MKKKTMPKEKISFGQKMTKLRSTFISIIKNLYTVEKYLPEVENKIDSSSNNFKFNSFHNDVPYLYPVEMSENQNFSFFLKWKISVKQVKEAQINNVDNKMPKSNPEKANEDHALKNCLNKCACRWMFTNF